LQKLLNYAYKNRRRIISQPKFLKINHAIESENIRLIDVNGNQMGIVSFKEGLMIAQQLGLDLVEISPDSQPPVCRILDYKKYLFSKKQSIPKAKKTQLKELQISLRIGEADYQVKKRQTEEFLKQGHMVKIFLQFRGREITFVDKGHEIMKRLEQDLLECGVVENPPSLQGKQMIMLLRKRGQNAKVKNT